MFMIPTLHQPPHLEMGKLVPERPSDLPKVTQLLDARIGCREDVAAFVPSSALRPVRADARPSDPQESRPRGHFFFVSPAQKRRAQMWLVE